MKFHSWHKKHLRTSRPGLALPEYALIFGLVILVCILGLTNLGQAIQDSLFNSAGAIGG